MFFKWHERLRKVGLLQNMHPNTQYGVLILSMGVALVTKCITSYSQKTKVKVTL